jgi:hypothetical protein
MRGPGGPPSSSLAQDAVAAPAAWRSSPWLLQALELPLVPHISGPRDIFGLDDLLRVAIVCGSEEETPMAFKPNYNLQRADRDRAARARNEEKQKRRDEKAAERRAKREGAVEAPTDGEKS